MSIDACLFEDEYSRAARIERNISLVIRIPFNN